MNTADYLVIAVIVISSIVGLLRGFLREAIAVVSWLAAVLIAWHWSGQLEPHLGGLLAAPQVRPWAARAILLFLVLFIGPGIGATVVYRFLGFLFGLLRGLVVLGVLVLFCQNLRLDGERWWRNSMLIPYGEDIAGALRPLLAEESGKRHELAAMN